MSMSKAAKPESPTSSEWAQILVSEDNVRSGIVGFAPAHDLLSEEGEEGEEAGCASSAVKFVRLLEGDIQHQDAVFTGPLHFSLEERLSPPGIPAPNALPFKTNPASRALYIRARLGHLSLDALQPSGSQWDPELQELARRLQTALQDAAGYIIREAPLKDGGWKRVKALAWSAVCDLNMEKGMQRLVAEFPIHFAMRQQRQRWLIDEYQLAAVMGLWRYSLFCRASNAPGFASRMTPKRKVMQAAGSLEHTAAVVRLWVARENLLEHKYESFPFPVPQEPGTFMLSAAASVTQSFGPCDIGWEPYQDGASAGQDLAQGRGAWLLSMPTTASLLEMMAQDIFTTFMFEAASIMDNLSDVCVRQPPSSSGDSILRNPNATSSELGNVHIDALARILCDSGLASEEAALMSIVPAFFHHGKLPSLDASIARLLNDAKKLRREGRYQQGETHLKSLLRICSPDHHQKVVRALGELCREASKSPSEFHRDFGLWAMAGLRQLNTQGVIALSQGAEKALEDYHQLYGFVKRDPRHGGKPWEAKPRPALDMASVAELRGDTDLPRDKGSRAKALLMLEKYDISGRHSLAVQEFLFVAIALGYTEVIEDLRALNPSLLLDLPSLEVPPGEHEPLTVVVQKKFKAGGEVESLDPKGKKPKGYLRSAAPIAFLATVWAASQLEPEDRTPGEAEDVLKAMLGWASITKADLTDGQNNTPLMYAARSGNLAAADILLECGDDFSVRNAAGETALSTAVAEGCLPIAERILEKGQQDGGLPHGYLHHALAVAFQLRKREYIELLLRHGADINEPDERGETLLFAAMEPFRAVAEAVRAHPRIIKSWRWQSLKDTNEADAELVALLIEYGAVVKQEELAFMLQIAVAIGAPGWIRQLRARDHDVVGMLNEHGTLTDLLEQPEEGQWVKTLIEVLLELGVTVQPRDLNLAVFLPAGLGILDLLLEKGSPTGGVLKDYGTAVQTVLNNSYWSYERAPEQEKKLEALIAARCDVISTRPSGKPPPCRSSAPGQGSSKDNFPSSTKLLWRKRTTWHQCCCAPVRRSTSPPPTFPARAGA
jgi:hypothetical protein